MSVVTAPPTESSISLWTILRPGARRISWMKWSLFTTRIPLKKRRKSFARPPTSSMTVFLSWTGTWVPRNRRLRVSSARIRSWTWMIMAGLTWTRASRARRRWSGSMPRFPMLSIFWNSFLPIRRTNCSRWRWTSMTTISRVRSASSTSWSWRWTNTGSPVRRTTRLSGICCCRCPRSRAIWVSCWWRTSVPSSSASAVCRPSAKLPQTRFVRSLPVSSILTTSLVFRVLRNSCM